MKLFNFKNIGSKLNQNNKYKNQNWYSDNDFTRGTMLT